MAMAGESATTNCKTILQIQIIELTVLVGIRPSEPPPLWNSKHRRTPLSLEIENPRRLRLDFEA